MSSSLSALRILMVKGLGGRDDSTANTVIDACLNYASTLAALLFEPPELQTKANLTLLANNSNISLSNLTDRLDIKSVYNSTDSAKMWYIPWESWEILVPSNVGGTKYFSIFGETLYAKDTPSANKVLNIGYSTYPSLMSNANDTVDFDHHDSFIISTALGIAWAFFEKGKTTTIEQAMNSITIPLTLGAKARQVIEGRKTSLSELLTQLQGGE